MPIKTTFLQMILPLNNEYQNIWDGPLNSNLILIDTKLEEHNTEIVGARGNKATLAEFLSSGHDQDGNLLPVPEVVVARNGFLYGDLDASDNPLTLGARLDLGDKEVLAAREGYPGLRDAIASHFSSQILSGTKSVLGDPTWLGFTGAQLQINGSVTPIDMLIDGYRSKIRTLKSLTISGAAGTKYLYATFSSTGQIVFDGDSTTAPPSSPNGVTTAGVDTRLCLFHDATVDWTAEDVQAGDVLTILGNVTQAGQYLIDEVAPDGDVNKLRIKGLFQGVSTASLNYTVHDRLAVTLGFDTAETATTGKLYIGEADWDGASVTAVRPRSFKNEYTSPWRAIDTSGGGSPTFEESFNHHIGSDILDVIVQASQANDGSAPVETLSVGTVASTLQLNFSNTLSFNPGIFSAGVFNPGTPGSGGTAPSYNPLPSMTLPQLTGTVTSSLTGTVYPDNAVATQYDRNVLKVKNIQPSTFYKDYDGAAQQTGFIRVLVKKRG